jgi:hypothetical protein
MHCDAHYRKRGNVLHQDGQANHWWLRRRLDAVPLASLYNSRQLSSVRRLPDSTRMGAHRRPLRQRVCAQYFSTFAM